MRARIPMRRTDFIRKIFFLACASALSASGFAEQSLPDAPAAQGPVAHPVDDADFSQARKLTQQGKFDDAIADLESLQANHPNAKGLDLELGTAYYKKSDFPKAIEYLKKATAADPRNGETIQLLGLSYYLGGHPADAIPLLEKVQGWYARANVDAAYILGICYIQTKDYPHARVAFARMFDVPPDSAASYMFTARMLLRQEFDPVAEEYAQKAATLDPKLPLVHFLLGELYLYKSRVPEAIAEFQKSLQSIPDTLPLITSWPTLTLVFRNLTTQNAFCSAPSGSTRPPPAPTFLWERFWKKRVSSNWRFAPCKGPQPWTRTIPPLIIC